jgi:hypothetical protein
VVFDAERGGTDVLYAFCFERVGVLVGDLYFVDPTPAEGQEGAERGVRLEVRLVERPPLPGSVYSAQPIAIDEPIWRVDLLETVDGPYGSFNRTHHHPRFRDWEPSHRNFDEALSADPLTWVGKQLGDLDALVASTGIDPSAVDPDDARQLRDAVPEILDRVRVILDRIEAGELATAPTKPTPPGEATRGGWL